MLFLPADGGRGTWLPGGLWEYIGHHCQRHCCVPAGRHRVWWAPPPRCDLKGISHLETRNTCRQQCIKKLALNQRPARRPAPASAAPGRHRLFLTKLSECYRASFRLMHSPPLSSSAVMAFVRRFAELPRGGMMAQPLNDVNAIALIIEPL